MGDARIPLGGFAEVPPTGKGMEGERMGRSERRCGHPWVIAPCPRPACTGVTQPPLGFWGASKGEQSPHIPGLKTQRVLA